MLSKVISGGQTGADQAGWYAAFRYGIETGGWMPKGFKTEDGLHPEFVEAYGAKEHWHPGYPPRTVANIRDANGTVIFTNNPRSPGTLLVGKISGEQRKPVLTVMPRGVWRSPAALVSFIRQHNIEVLNVSGNRASSFPEIGHWVELYLGYAFRRLGFTEHLPLAARTRVTRVSVQPTMVGTTNRLQAPQPEPRVLAYVNGDRYKSVLPVIPRRKKHSHRVKAKKSQPQPKTVNPAVSRLPMADLPEWSPTPSATYQYRNRPGKPASRNHVPAEYEEFIPDQTIKPPWDD